MSKKINNCIRDKKRSGRQEKIQRILEEVSGIKNISNIKPSRKRTLIQMVKNVRGDAISSRNGIANVSVEFKSKSYADNQCEETELEIEKNETENDKSDQSVGADELKEIPEFTSEELQAAIDRLKKGYPGDSNGIRAEDIKTCDEGTKETVRQIFNEMPKQKDCTPETWRRLGTKVMHKDGPNFESSCSVQLD